MKGRLYGIGVGPGDPELLTIKALRLIRSCDVIAVPGESAKESIAYKIVKGAYEEIDQKELLALPMPMTKDHDMLKKNHDHAASIIQNLLDQGKDVAFLTLGDPTVYSTYLYVHQRVQKTGYETEIINGIPSFCAVAARLNMGLVEKAEPLHIIPATYQMEEALELTGTKVFMKAGKKIGKVKEKILADGASGMMIENCGMENEKIYRTIEEIPENAGYYSLIIIKEKGE